MARQTKVVLISDLSGNEATTTVPFAHNGVTYEIDLTDSEAKQFGQAMAKYTSAGRRIGGRQRRRNGAAAASGTS